MPITFEKLVAVVRERAELDLSPSVVRSGETVDQAIVERIVLYTVNGIGMHVSTSGEVCDPRPKPVINYPEQRNVRYRRRY